MILGGLALVVLDFRTASPDLLPDIVGWGLIAVAARRLTLTAAASLAVVAGLASLADLWLSYRHIPVDPTTGELVLDGSSADRGGPAQFVYDDVSGWRLTAMSIAAVLAGLALWALLAGLAKLARSRGRDGPARQFRIVGWLIPAVWTVPYLAAVVNAVVNESGAFDPVWNGALVYVWLLSFALFVYLAVLLLREHDESWTRPVGSPVPSRWEARRSGSPRAAALNAKYTMTINMPVLPQLAGQSLMQTSRVTHRLPNWPRVVGTGAVVDRRLASAMEEPGHPAACNREHSVAH